MISSFPPSQNSIFQKNNHKSVKFSVDWYVNGNKTSSAMNMTSSQAYDTAIPGEALIAVDGSRWHVMVRQAALSTMSNLKPGQSFKVCYEDPVLPGQDNETIMITRNQES